MADISRDDIDQVLRSFIDPYLKKDWLLLEAVKNIIIDGNSVSVELELGYPCQSVKQTLESELQEKLTAITEVEVATVRIQVVIPASIKPPTEDNLAAVKHIIPVASGKGGVGKSTTAVNLALALAAEGAKVGILDADIYGPSQHIMLGLGTDERPEVVNEQFFMPMKAHGIVSISMGNLVTENTPMVWRGPMASGALQQLIKQTQWGELDYLIIDMPPGTGDIQLTISQSLPTAGAVVVTTPQDIALLDAKKGIEMFRKVDVPVLGIVENMALHVCSQCGHHEHVFGEGGGERIAVDYDTVLLGALPLDITIREDVDGGTPSVVNQPESLIAECYRKIARHVAARIWEQSRSTALKAPEIVISND